MTFPNSSPFSKVVFLCYNEEAFTHQENALAVILLLMLYGWAIIPFIYLTSFCFHNAGGAFVKLIIVLIFLSICPFILVTVTSEKGEDRYIYTSPRHLILPPAATEVVLMKVCVSCVSHESMSCSLKSPKLTVS